LINPSRFCRVNDFGQLHDDCPNFLAARSTNLTALGLESTFTFTPVTFAAWLVYNIANDVTQATDHDEISEVDDCDGSCDEEMASAMKLFSVEQ